MKTEQELIKLSEEIRDAEIMLVDRKESNNRNEQSYEIQVWTKCREIERENPLLCSKGNELGTIEKRRIKAEEDPQIQTLKNEIEAYRRDNQMMEIILEHQKRLFKIHTTVTS